MSQIQNEPPSEPWIEVVRRKVAAIRFGSGGVVEDARIVLGAVASRPLLVPESSFLAGKILTDDVIEQFAERASSHAKPLDNTDFHMTWRKAMARQAATAQRA